MRHGIIKRDGSVEPVELTDWCEWFEAADDKLVVDGGRIVARTDLPGEVVVSTVFLGLNHSFIPDRPPLWFETMIFGGVHDEFTNRYATFADAVAGHESAVAMAGTPSP